MRVNSSVLMRSALFFYFLLSFFVTDKRPNKERVRIRNKNALCQCNSSVNDM